ncbi:phage antirepressor protein [Nitrosospira lacus]|uniref:hypothetical protein n=1 Tax=Nitrosospira lacus TaxID=1288494 RepID=UPI0002C52E3A|nr:hypothetical protein [Nitrosospira lacus]ASD48284.1 phage antirepressor protein [Nitrosospira lacus]
MPYQIHLDAERFSVYTGESQKYAYQQTRVEPKGVAWLAEIYAVKSREKMVV